MKTKEERDAAKLQRREILEAERKRFPGARIFKSYDDFGVSIDLESGDPNFLQIAKRGEWPSQWTNEPSGSTWSEIRIFLNDPPGLAKFIRALIARYNAMVSDMNAEANECAMDPAKAIE